MVFFVAPDKRDIGINVFLSSPLSLRISAVWSGYTMYSWSKALGTIEYIDVKQTSLLDLATSLADLNPASILLKSTSDRYRPVGSDNDSL